MTIHDMVRSAGTTYSRILGAVVATGIKGRVVRGTRVWTEAEYRKIVRHMNAGA